MHIPLYHSQYSADSSKAGNDGARRLSSMDQKRMKTGRSPKLQRSRNWVRYRAFVLGMLAGAGCWSILMQFSCIYSEGSVLGEGVILRQHLMRPSLCRHTSDNNFPMIVTGLIPDGALIKNEILTTLVQLSCLYGTPVHATVAENADALKSLFGRLQEDLYRPQTTNIHCKALQVDIQPAFPSEDLSRVEKLAILRDFQRRKLMEIIKGIATSTDSIIIMVLDFDLLELPPVFQIMEAACTILGGLWNNGAKRTSLSVDAVCAGGVVVDNQDGREGYYDSFATIFEPDTYMVPLAMRAISVLRPGENKDLILADNDLNFYEIWEGMRNQQSVPVRSCYGGLALYRASNYLDEQCSYSGRGQGINVSVYEVLNEGVCEHIVFNSCLHTLRGMKMSILPALRTRWTPDGGLSIPKDLNIAATKFKLTLNKTKTSVITKKQRAQGGVVPLAQLEENPKIRQGDTLVVLKPGLYFGMEAKVVLNGGKTIHVNVGSQILPMGLRDLGLLKPQR